ncbi:MAG: hypothetical protein KAQ66_04105 [Rhodospirillaceae bacterium]|nr:hypothetical protein [Rhodospirillaceae bacterium]MCK5546501.1 hypothetical protein [Rhodospirillaceae bacterium]
MQADKEKEMDALVRLLQYAVKEAERLGVNEIAWAKGLSQSCILLEVGDNGLSSYMEIDLNGEEFAIRRLAPFLSLVPT